MTGASIVALWLLLSGCSGEQADQAPPPTAPIEEPAVHDNPGCDLAGRVAAARAVEDPAHGLQALGSLPAECADDPHYPEAVQVQGELARALVAEHLGEEPTMRPVPGAEDDAPTVQAEAAESDSEATTAETTASVEPEATVEPQRTCTPTSPDYNRCLIDTLEGRASGAIQQAQLIEAYRATGNQPAALRHMSAYVRDHGQTSRGRQYCQILTRNGRTCTEPAP